MEKYQDYYGEVWVRIDEYQVKRLRDGMLGGWFNGNGLFLIT